MLCDSANQAKKNNRKGEESNFFNPYNYQEVTLSRDQIVPVFKCALYFFKKDELRCVTGFIITRRGA